MGKRRKKGEGSVRQRKDGRWEGRVVIGYDEKGLPRTKNVLAKTKRECQEKLKQLRETVTGPKTEKVRPEMPFGEWLDFWYQNYVKPQIRPTTQANYEAKIYQHIIPELGKIPLNQLAQKDLQQFYARMKTAGRLIRTEQFGKGLSDSMVRGLHAACRSALEKAVQEELIRTNPAVGCKLPPKRGREMQVLGREELQRFLIQAQAEVYFEFYLLDLSTGMRRGEMQALQWDERGEGAAPGEHPQDPRLHPQAGPAARRGGGAAGVSGDGGLPVDVPLAGQRGHAHDTGSGAPAAPDHSGAGRVQENQIS